jgi:hypothetical protein
MLRIALVKESKEGSVSQVLEVQSVIGHVIHVPRKEGGQVVASVQPLVLTGAVAEAHCHAFGRDGAPRDLGDSRGVVRGFLQTDVAHVVELCHNGHLAQQPGMLQSCYW